jgi:SAM-dependent methyltransferase
MTTAPEEHCQVCGHDGFDHRAVVWPELAEAWALTPEERAIIDIQQGTCCQRCGANVRSQALARALRRVAGAGETLDAFVALATSRGLRLLEVNEAGTLTPWLSRLPGHTLTRFPEVDLRQLPFQDGAFDLVVHSDTLEHVEQPLAALRECWRVLAPGGACVFTVPVLAGRLTASRRGLPASYHGDPSVSTDDHIVHFEFGADVWTFVLEAGFTSSELVPCRFPAGLAVVGYR